MIETTTKKTGLRLMEARTPYKDYFGMVLDLEGEWTTGMLESDYLVCVETGLMVWEGSCQITTTDAGTDDEVTSYSYEGTWRRPTAHEAGLLCAGLRPFSGAPFPADEDALIRVPA